ncbi:cytochrome P450 [Populus alba x Populus x berolinensis]|nr:cytochrome P450 [Populus alba x Populus x berolinensis]
MEYLAATSFTTLLSSPASLLVLAIILFYFIQSHKNVKKHPLPPGPKPWPIVGCLPTMLRNKAQDNTFASRPHTMTTDLISRGYLTTILSPSGDQWNKMKKVLMTHCKKSVHQGGIVNLRTAAQHYCANVTRKMLFNKRFFGKGMKDGGPGFEEEEYVDAFFSSLNHDGAKKDTEDLLDILITLKDPNSNPLLLDNPSNACEWAFAEMLNQPEILEKATEELDRVVGKERLEAFRLHPVAPFNVPHVSAADTTVANYFIPKGSYVLLSRLGLGRNPKKTWVHRCDTWDLNDYHAIC